MRRILIWVSIATVALLQIVQAALGVVTQAFEARSDFGIPMLTIATLTPFLASLYVIDSIRIRRHRVALEASLALAVTIYTLCNCLFSLYRIGRKFSLDLLWIWYNITDVYPTLIAIDDRLPYYLAGGFIVLAFHYFGFNADLLSAKAAADSRCRSGIEFRSCKRIGGIVRAHVERPLHR